MSDRRWIVAVCIVVMAAMGFSVGSTGYTATTADRPVAVDVVRDADASLGLSYAHESVTVEPGTERTLVRIRNLFTQRMDVHVSAVADEVRGVAVDLSPVEGRTLSPGAEFAVPIQVQCVGSDTVGRSATVSFAVRAVGESIAIETAESRTVTYSVACPS